MRRIYSYWLAILATGSLALASCEKEAPTERVIARPVTPVGNTAPQAYAGEDIWVVTPGNSCTLSGAIIDEEQNVVKYLWNKVAGPSSFLIESPNSIDTKVSRLEKGTYEFEFVATDKGGLITKDTITVYVMDPAPPGHGEALFSGLAWACPMGCSVVIKCFSCFVPPGQPYKVYLRKGGTTPWIEVLPEAEWTTGVQYSYGVYDNALVVFSMAEEGNDAPDIKVTY